MTTIDEPSAALREAAAAYRRHAGLDDARREALLARVQASIAAGDDARRVVDPDPTDGGIDVRRSAWRIGVALAAAAAILLALRLWAGRDAATRGAGEPDRGQAAFGLAPGDPPHGSAAPGPADAADPRRPEQSPADGPATQRHARPPDARTGARDAGETTPQATNASGAASAERDAAPRTPRSQRRAPTDAPADPAGTPTAETGLAAEMALLRAARTALRDARPALALRRLAEHEAAFAQGQLAEDRDALRVQALCDAGRRDEARTAAIAFARTHPGSPHAARVARMCTAR